MKRVQGIVVLCMVLGSMVTSGCTKQAVVPAYAREKPHAKMLRAPVAMDTTLMVSPGN